MNRNWLRIADSVETTQICELDSKKGELANQNCKDRQIGFVRRQIGSARTGELDSQSELVNQTRICNKDRQIELLSRLKSPLQFGDQKESLEREPKIESESLASL